MTPDPDEPVMTDTPSWTDAFEAGVRRSHWWQTAGWAGIVFGPVAFFVFDGLAFTTGTFAWLGVGLVVCITSWAFTFYVADPAADATLDEGFVDALGVLQRRLDELDTGGDT